MWISRVDSKRGSEKGVRSTLTQGFVFKEKFGHFFVFGYRVYNLLDLYLILLKFQQVH